MRVSCFSSLTALCAALSLPAVAAFISPEGFEQYSAFKDIHWMPKKLETVRGDTLMVSFMARGKGRATLKLFLYGANDAWCGGSSNKAMILSDAWRRFDHRIVVTDNGRPTEKVAFAFGAPPGDDPDFEFRDFSYELVKASERGLVGAGSEMSYTLVSERDTWRPLEFKVDVPETFDPVARQWPLVFADEFDGTVLDAEKWTNDPPSVPVVPNESLRLDGQGHLEIICDVGKDGKLRTGGMWTTREFLWGYYEARVKFTHQPGWWAAFMLYATSDTNPLLDGYEVDVFEDEYMRAKDKNGEWSRKFSITVHSIANGILKSWDYTGAYEGSPDDWHVVGCLRTPFALAVYIDGHLVKTQETHAPYDAAVFDPFNHAACTVPLHIVFTGALSDPGRKRPATQNAVFPEAYRIDYVRAYEMPSSGLSVAWKKPSQAAFVSSGETLTFDLSVRGAKAGGGIRGAYLFDNGNLVAFREKTPWRFDLPFTEQAYSSTRYLEPARTGVKSELVNGYAHVFAAAVQDEQGRVAFTEPLVRLPPVTMSPVETNAPGVFKLPEFTITGNKTAAVRLTVPKKGDYEISFSYWTTTRVRNELKVAVDGLWAGSVALPPTDWRRSERRPATLRLKLKAGVNDLTFFLNGRASFSEFSVSAAGS